MQLTMESPVANIKEGKKDPVPIQFVMEVKSRTLIRSSAVANQRLVPQPPVVLTTLGLEVS